MSAATGSQAASKQRLQMTTQQVRTWDVLDADVLAVQASVAREVFVPRALQAVAYADAPIPLGDGQHLWAPKLDGKVLQALAIKRYETILEVGSGSGYLSACLAGLGAHVTSLEINPRLAALAKQHLAQHFIANVEIIAIDALKFVSEARFDAILVGASVESVPSVLMNFLKPTGRLIAPIGATLQTMTLFEHPSTGIDPVGLFETTVDPLIRPVVKHFDF